MEAELINWIKFNCHRCKANSTIACLPVNNREHNIDLEVVL